MKKSPGIQLECAHCLQPVAEAVLSDDGHKTYCCFGCKVVDQLLTDKGRIISQGSLNTTKYNFLDEPKIRKSLLSFEDAGYASISVHLPQIHCSSCIYLLENLPDIEEGILEVKLHFSKKQAQVTFQSDKLLLSQVAALLDYLGYPPDFQTQLGGEKKTKKPPPHVGWRGRLLLWQYHVAGTPRIPPR